jgi:hypothetical protein
MDVRPQFVRPARDLLKPSVAVVDACRVETTDAINGRPDATPGDSLILELSVTQAQALRTWLLKPAADGSSTMDDEVLKPVMSKLGSELDFREGVIAVRQELEQAGLATANLSDEQVAVLGRKIADAKLRPAAAQS